MMEPFTAVTSLAVPLLRDNIDTDAIIPSREMRSVSRKGLADGLFAGWRYRAIGTREPDPGFVLNDPSYAGARILLAGANFGCGSSREHAAWALAEYGFRAVIAASFNSIFQGNCIANGMVPVALESDTIATIAEAIGAARLPVTIDLVRQEVRTPGGAAYSFLIDSQARKMLLEGLDPIALTLQSSDRIAVARKADALARPWIYLDGPDRGL
jgi:3-isopropylmalate/(R)-2-methylmalate dehydratase small subunit